jgi:hypothetical protein
MELLGSSVGISDVQEIFTIVEQLAIIGVVLALAYVFLRNKKLFSKKAQRVLWVLVIGFALAIAVQYGLSAYNYFHYIRPEIAAPTSSVE